MKRPLAIALTIAIFAAIAVCFLRPAPSELGRPKPIFEPNTPLELSGDTEYFECAEVLEVNRIDDDIELLLVPSESYVLHIGAGVDEYGSRSIERGYVERFTDGEWMYLRELRGPTMEAAIWLPPRRYSLSWNDEKGTAGHRCTLHSCHELDAPGEYRYTLYFRQIKGMDELFGDIISLSFTITVPDEPTGKKFDVFTSNHYQLLIRSNCGKPAPYLVPDSICVTDPANGEVVIETVGVHAFSPSEGGISRSYVYSDSRLYDLPFGEYEISLEFAEHDDGSGKRYPFSYTTTFGK